MNDVTRQLNSIVPHCGTRTSLESACLLAQDGRAGEAGVAVLKCIGESEGVACFEIEKLLNMKHQTASGRITVLRKHLGLVYCEGDTHYNKETNRNCEVYRMVTNLKAAQQVDPKCGVGMPGVRCPTCGRHGEFEDHEQATSGETTMTHTPDPAVLEKVNAGNRPRTTKLTLEELAILLAGITTGLVNDETAELARRLRARLGGTKYYDYGDWE